MIMEFTMGVFRPIVVFDNKFCSKDEGEMLISVTLITDSSAWG